jgi:FKBP-type peptidyl-prolyl cis-trans isomerase
LRSGTVFAHIENIKFAEMKRINFLIGIGLIFLLVAGCNTTGTWEKQERTQIQSYIKSLGDTVYVLKPSGLYYIELQAGTGRMPIAKDTIAFRYKGMFLDRVVFDSNMASSQPYTAVIGGYEIIAGLDEGVKYMKAGGIGRFVTPSSLAYGPAGIWGLIPGYTPLLWEIELISVKAGTK